MASHNMYCTVPYAWLSRHPMRMYAGDVLCCYCLQVVQGVLEAFYLDCLVFSEVEVKIFPPLIIQAGTFHNFSPTAEQILNMSCWV